MNSGSHPANRRQHRQTPQRSRPTEDGQQRQALQALAREIEDALVAAAWQTYGEMYGFQSEAARRFTLELRVDIEPGQTWRLGGGQSVAEQIRRAVRDMATRLDAFQYGRVYCYRCESSGCEHSIPPRSTCVFGGYSSTGLPEWPELSQVMIELQHPNADQVFEPGFRELFISHIGAEELKRRQLNVFGRHSKTFDILGQVVAGFFRVLPPGEGVTVTDRVAFTLQGVESRRADGSPRVDLNVLGRLEDGSPAIDGFDGPYQLRIYDIIMDARQRIANLTPPRRPHLPAPRQPRLRHDTIFVVNDVLREVARSLQHIGRQRERRTEHAETRRIESRPAPPAVVDALAAPDDHVLFDEPKQTVVVIGPRSRVHVFSLEGRHVTSMQFEPEAIRNRLRRRRWRKLTPDEAERFNAAVGRIPEAKR